MPSTVSAIEAYANALLEVARAEGHLGEIEDDLFRFARTFEGHDELRIALTDPSLPAARRMAVVEELMGGKALQTSSALGVVHRRRRPRRRARRRSSTASSSWPRPSGGARSPRCAARSPLDAPSRPTASREALSEATGKQVEVKVIVDATVLGGIVARVGDTVIDGVRPSPARAAAREQI